MLHSPYPLVPGGGERVMLELSSHLSALAGSPKVVFSTPHRYSTLRLRQIAAEFGLHAAVGTPLPWDLVESSRCQVGFVLGNSIVPPLPAFGSRCVYLLQFPFWVPDEEVAQHGSMLAAYDEIWVYSDFVRRNVNGLVRHYGLSAPPVHVVPPPAAWAGAGPGLPWTERRTVLSVGRFFAGAHNKRQDVVIEAFRRLVAHGHGDLHLALAGSIHPSPDGRARFHELNELAAGLDCSFHPNIGREELATLYSRSAVLIHTTGFGVDPDEFPEKLEHFGITPVEAASFGCIPVVYGQGGPREVLRVLGCDTAFATVEDCVRIVRGLLADPARSSSLSAHLCGSSQAYSGRSFAARVDEGLRRLGALGVRAVSGAPSAPVI